MMSDLPTDQPIIEVMTMTGEKSVFSFGGHRFTQNPMI